MPSGGRRSIRLPEYDYASPGAYFITIATKEKQGLFGAISDDEVQLSDWGRIAADCWLEVPQHFSQVKLDEFIVMPNHVHGILWILPPELPHVGATHASPCFHNPKANAQHSLRLCEEWLA